jgi:hypothetical protein
VWMRRKRDLHSRPVESIQSSERNGICRGERLLRRNRSMFQLGLEIFERVNRMAYRAATNINEPTCATNRSMLREFRKLLLSQPTSRRLTESAAEVRS